VKGLDTKEEPISMGGVPPRTDRVSFVVSTADRAIMDEFAVFFRQNGRKASDAAILRCGLRLLAKDKTILMLIDRVIAEDKRRK